MTAPAVLSGPEAADPAWFMRVLRSAGVLGEDSVCNVHPEMVGNGLIGDSVRFALEYDGPAVGAPRSLVCKFASKDAPSRAAAIRLLLYRREVDFYNEIAPSVGIRTPRTYFAMADEAGEEFTLVMEDLAPARGGDQIAGCSEADCVVAMREIAALHAPRWNSPLVDKMPWLRAREANIPRHVQVMPELAARFLKSYEAEVSEPDCALIERFVDRFGLMMHDRASPRTIVHADFRLDNVMFDIHGQAGTMATLDWQTVGVDAGMLDVAFFVGGALEVEQRRRHEQDLVRGYLEVLREHGVMDYGWNACWRDYRRLAVRNLFTPVVSAGSFKRTPRGDQMFMTLLRRLCQQSMDLASLDCWD